MKNKILLKSLAGLCALAAVARGGGARRHFLEACRLDERMEYRGNLDPEIAELLK